MACLLSTHRCAHPPALATPLTARHVRCCRLLQAQMLCAVACPSPLQCWRSRQVWLRHACSAFPAGPFPAASLSPLRPWSLQSCAAETGGALSPRCPPRHWRSTPSGGSQCGGGGLMGTLAGSPGCLARLCLTGDTDERRDMDDMDPSERATGKLAGPAATLDGPAHAGDDLRGGTLLMCFRLVHRTRAGNLLEHAAQCLRCISTGDESQSEPTWSCWPVPGAFASAMRPV